MGLSGILGNILNTIAVGQTADAWFLRQTTSPNTSGLAYKAVTGLIAHCDITRRGSNSTWDELPESATEIVDLETLLGTRRPNIHHYE